MRTLSTLWTDEAGAVSLETALLVIVVALAGMAAWRQLAGSIDRNVAETNGYLCGSVGPARVRGPVH